MREIRLVHVLRFAFGAGVLVWLLTWVGPQKDPKLAAILRSFRSERKVFVDDFLHNDVDGPFNGTAIRRYCDSKVWTPGLALSCDAVPGDIGDVKNGVLTCIRIAIEMGAELFLPQIALRSPTDYATTPPKNRKGPLRGAPLSRFFDSDHLNASLAQACPQMKLHESIDAFFDKPGMQVAARLDLTTVPGVPMKGVTGVTASRDGRVGRMLKTPETLGQAIHARLDELSPPRKRKYPYRVSLGPTPMYIFPAGTHGEEAAFRNHFGRLLRVRQDLRRVAATVLFNLRRAYGLEGGLDPRKGIDIDSFAGVELRTQPDPQKALPDYSTQASDALSFVVYNGMSLVYLAEGATPEDAEAFAMRCIDFGVTVVTKDALVGGDESALLEGLSYDERFLVDYEILLRAGLFTGQALSSVAWNVALRRQNAFGDAGRVNASHLVEGSIRWHDQYATLYGQEWDGEQLRQAIWP